MKDIRGTTKLCALLGNPTQHSLSPMIHNNLASLTKTDVAYTTFSVEKEAVEMAVKGAFALGIVGMNVTVPYKQEVMRYLVGTDPLAEAIGAVNTLVRKQDGYYGYNTDILGFLRELEVNNFKLENRDVVILGAGGVARAIAFACAREGANRIYILNRSFDKARVLAYDLDAYFGFLKGDKIIPMSLCQSEEVEAKDFLLVQTTDIGMHPNVDAIILEESKLYDEAAFGFDVIYNPYNTCFMNKLKSKGKRAVNGLPMLLYQGVEAYKMWFEDSKITKDMEKSIYAKLKVSFSGDESLKLEKDKKEAQHYKGNLILVGFMGSGKTTLGKWISKRTGRDFIDTDKEVEIEAGKTIKEIFEDGGEESFRALETMVLKKLENSKNKNMVISVGGGTPLRPENRAILKKIGTVIYLRASGDELMRRLRYDERRPLLQGKNGDARQELINHMLKAREPMYLASANLVVRTDGVYFPRIYQIINKRIKSGKVNNNPRFNKKKVKPKAKQENNQQVDASENVKNLKRNNWRKNRQNYRKEKE